MGRALTILAGTNLLNAPLPRLDGKKNIVKHVLGTFEVEESEYGFRFSKFEHLRKILRRVAGMGGIGLA